MTLKQEMTTRAGSSCSLTSYELGVESISGGGSRSKNRLQLQNLRELYLLLHALQVAHSVRAPAHSVRHFFILRPARTSPPDVRCVASR